MEKTSYTERLSYQTHSINFVEYQQYDNQGDISERYAHLTNISAQEAVQITKQGRMRWKIENEGFNT